MSLFARGSLIFAYPLRFRRDLLLGGGGLRGLRAHGGILQGAVRITDGISFLALVGALCIWLLGGLFRYGNVFTRSRWRDLLNLRRGILGCIIGSSGGPSVLSRATASLKLRWAPLQILNRRVRLPPRVHQRDARASVPERTLRRLT